MIAHLETGEATLSTVDEIIPDIYAIRARDWHRWRFATWYKSHEPYNPRYRSVVYLARNPMDVLPSYHRYARFAGSPLGDLSLGEFVERALDGTVDRYGAWHHHVGSWLGARLSDEVGFLVVRYEDLVRDPARELKRVADALGKPWTDSRVRAAIEATRPEHLREQERNGARLKPLAAATGPGSFIGSATVGRGAHELDPETRQLVISAAGYWMSRLNYLEESHSRNGIDDDE